MLSFLLILSSPQDSPTENCSTPTSNDTNVVKEGVEHSSPVSVLDQFSDEAITSPLRGEPGKPSI